MNIQTLHWPKPIPTNRFDWEAWDDDNENSSIGYGETEEGAISELKELISNDKNGFDELAAMGEHALKLLAL